MIAMIISKNYPPSSIYIISEFNSATEVAKSEPLLDYFQEVKMFNSRQKAIIFACKKKPDKVFIDSDVGLKTYIQLCLFKLKRPKSEIHVYEEGIGTYRTDLIPSIPKKILHKAIGAACYFGDSIAVKKIHVFDVKKHAQIIPHLKKKTLSIPQSMSTFIEDNEKTILNIFCPKFKLEPTTDSRDAYIYLSDWDIEEKEITTLIKKKNIFIKPHPHKKEIELEPYRRIIPSAQWIPGSIPAEVILLMLSKKYTCVFVKHKKSSSIHYMSHLKNLIET